MDLSKIVSEFCQITNTILDKVFPVKKKKVFEKDKPWMTKNLHKLRRKKQRIYAKEGRSLKFKEMHQEFLQMKKKEIVKMKEKLKESFRDSKKGIYKKLRDLGTKKQEENDFPIEEVDDLGLNPKETADYVANHFAAISRELEPLKVEDLPPKLKETLHANSLGPELSEYGV